MDHTITLIEKGDKEPSILSKLESIAKIASFVAIPLLGIYFGSRFEEKMNQRRLEAERTINEKVLEKQWADLAISILSNEDFPDEFRPWAVKLLNENSPLPFSPDLAQALETGRAFLPAIRSTSYVNLAPSNTPPNSMGFGPLEEDELIGISQAFNRIRKFLDALSENESVDKNELLNARISVEGITESLIKEWILKYEGKDKLEYYEKNRETFDPDSGDFSEEQKRTMREIGEWLDTTSDKILLE